MNFWTYLTIMPHCGLSKPWIFPIGSLSRIFWSERKVTQLFFQLYPFMISGTIFPSWMSFAFLKVSNTLEHTRIFPFKWQFKALFLPPGCLWKEVSFQPLFLCKVNYPKKFCSHSQKVVLRLIAFQWKNPEP